MRINNQDSSVTNHVPSDAGGAYAGPVRVKVGTGTFASTLTPSVAPTTGRPIWRYPVSGNCTLAALAGTSSLANDEAVAGSIFLTFSGSYTVTIDASYKLPIGVTNSIVGAAGQIWRVDFQYDKSVGRCSASAVQEAA